MRVGRPEPFVDQGFLIVKDDLWVLSLYGVFQQDIGPDNLTTYSRYPIEWGSGSTARSEHQPAHDHLDLTPVGTGQYVRAGALPGCRVVRCAAGLLAHGCVGDWTNPVSTNTPDVNFRISVVSREPIPIPTDRFSVRQNSAIWFDGYYYLYADVIPWDHPYHDRPPIANRQRRTASSFPHGRHIPTPLHWVTAQSPIPGRCRLDTR